MSTHGLMERSQLQFMYGHRNVRITMIDGQPWWIAKDVCDVLSITDARKSVNLLDADERNTIPVIDAMGRPQLTLVINEPGLYSLILRSRKPEAKAFKRWVVREILPEIRRTGMYIGAQTDGRRVPVNFVEALEMLLSAEKERLRLQGQLQTMLPAESPHINEGVMRTHQTIAQVAKALGIGRNRLFAFLREKRILMWDNLPYQRYLEREYFVVQELQLKQAGGSNIKVSQTVVTQKGIDFIRSIFTNPMHSHTRMSAGRPVKNIGESPLQAYISQAVAIAERCVPEPDERHCYFCEHNEPTGTRYGRHACDDCLNVEMHVVASARTFPDHVQATRLKLIVGAAKHGAKNGGVIMPTAKDVGLQV